MLKFRNLILVSVALVANVATAQAEKRGLGREALPAEIAAWDIDVRPDGLGLPEGKGKVSEGDVIFAEKCASCHGDFGEGKDRWPELAGGRDTLVSDDPVKTIGSFWPYTSTVYDYVHRAMPFGDAQSLDANQTYALVAYLLYLNDVVTDTEFELSKENFNTIKLPNEANFIDDDRPDAKNIKDDEPCMKDCKADVKVTMRARILDVTPEDGGEEGGNLD
jgi:S-disulfanyl-L-cysteine oxidoreductase SoxD